MAGTGKSDSLIEASRRVMDKKLTLERGDSLAQRVFLKL
jgi:hypothetical protein